MDLMNMNSSGRVMNREGKVTEWRNGRIRPPKNSSSALHILFSGWLELELEPQPKEKSTSGSSNNCCCGSSGSLVARSHRDRASTSSFWNSDSWFLANVFSCKCCSIMF
ncbi:hypothetical protein HanIR_Chr12g0596271 [Helianthus annuus]|nr:hypothetical protein HanIR_Chr12g0596271 [Helianthus annuus]